MNKHYTLTINDTVLKHHASPQPLVRDKQDDGKELEIDVLVASGDCFAMIATALDQLADDPFADNVEMIRPQLEKYVHTLLYLQRHYEIVPKYPEYRHL